MILIVCGPPGAGKTTVSARAAERLAAVGTPFEVLHSDDFSRRTYERLYDRVAERPDDDWLLDGTFYRREWQERFLRLPDVHLVHVTASLETCLERNRARENGIDERGVYVVHGEFDDPGARADLALDTDELGIDEAVDALASAVRRWRDDK
ncbi:AAA family ATPase [Haloprofundus salinisoli]|uniref:AAA family ATPase n=1 Tax=Haloprofundus salinisoli TaxID=2876193 RepID=UPI001CCF4268|nr:AAA family ATPase [Haloprofundus salinisoli]